MDTSENNPAPPNRHDIADVAPTALTHLIGNDLIKDQVSVALECAWADGKKFENTLLVGPPGMGKSALANVIAHEMGVGENFTEVLGQSITSIADLNALLLGATQNGILHIDEAHELDKQFQTALYLAVDKHCIFVRCGNLGKPQPIPIADCSILLSTTDEYCLLAPLRDRMRLTLRFQYLTLDELTEVVRQRSQALRWAVEEEVFPLIAQRSKGVPRLALKLLMASRRVCRSENETTITLQHLDRACTLEQMDKIGLGTLEQQFLRLLADRPSRLGVISSILGLPPRTISQVIEPYLLRAGLICKDDQSRRELTAKGREHLFGNVPGQSISV